MNMAYTEDQLGIACDLQGKMLPRKMNGPTPLSASEASLANNVTSKCFVDASVLLLDIVRYTIVYKGSMINFNTSNV